MKYPGRVIKQGESDAAIVKAIRDQLSQRGYAPTATSTGFDASLKALVRLFQSQHSDANGSPLKIDGTVGPMTWGALFGAKEPNVSVKATIAVAALTVAIGEVGTMEVPPGSNKGPEVNAYLASTGLDGGYFWCMAFVYWCFREAAQQSGLPNPFPKTAGCLEAWRRVLKASPANIITKAQAQANPALVKPGSVFILDLGKGMGHTGFVRSNAGGALTTIEGNSNPLGSNNGVGVFELKRRSVMTPNLKGFINFT